MARIRGRARRDVRRNRPGEPSDAGAVVSAQQGYCARDAARVRTSAANAQGDDRGDRSWGDVRVRLWQSSVVIIILNH